MQHIKSIILKSQNMSDVILHNLKVNSMFTTKKKKFDIMNILAVLSGREKHFVASQPLLLNGSSELYACLLCVYMLDE
jgi:hypothetical protein